MIFTTIEQLPEHYQVEEIIDVIEYTASRKLNGFNLFFKKDERSEAYAELKEMAFNLGGNAILGLHITTAANQNYLYETYYGTVVKVTNKRSPKP